MPKAMDAKTSCKTSDHTLAELPYLPPSMIRQADTRKHEKEIDAQNNDLAVHLFPQWRFELQQGFNLCLYGYGSKRDLLHQFAEQYLKPQGHPILAINGYHADLTLTNITSLIASQLPPSHSDDATAITSPIDMIEQQQQQRRTRKQLYIIIHNIDGGALRGEETKKALARLARIPGLSIIASIDHVYARLAWNQEMMASFNFVFHDATTYRPYTAELRVAGLPMFNGRGANASLGIHDVLQSLTQNAKAAFLLLAKWQTAKSADKRGLAYKAFYDLCRRHFLVTTDKTFRAMLQEFRDHKIILGKQGPDGYEYLRINAKAHELSDLINSEI